MRKTFEKSLFHDPLTRLPNFFSLIESDVRELFRDHGSVILFDFNRFGDINSMYGHDTGDMYLRVLAEIISGEICSNSFAKAFRTDGDEFTVILPGVLRQDAKSIAGKILSAFSVETNQYNDLGIRSLVFDYTEEIKSISKFYNLILQKSLDSPASGTGNTRWIEDIIDSFTRRIRETLSNFNDAYLLAMADDVSGLPNHRAGKNYLDQLIKESEMRDQHFSIMFIDGDNLRRYNEVGYQAGNKMIKELSDILNNSLRKGDRIFRWLSGDEFLVVLPNVNSENALKLAERTRKCVEDNTREWVYPVTISIGVAHYSNDTCDIEDVINKAERANQFAKNLGKNRVVNWNLAYEKNINKSIS